MYCALSISVLSNLTLTLNFGIVIKHGRVYLPLAPLCELCIPYLPDDPHKNEIFHNTSSKNEVNNHTEFNRLLFLLICNPQAHTQIRKQTSKRYLQTNESNGINVHLTTCRTCSGHLAVFSCEGGDCAQTNSKVWRCQGHMAEWLRSRMRMPHIIIIMCSALLCNVVYLYITHYCSGLV